MFIGDRLLTTQSFMGELELRENSFLLYNWCFVIPPLIEEDWKVLFEIPLAKVVQIIQMKWNY